MSVYSYRVTQYMIECDRCGDNECCPDSWVEKVHSKQQAIKWAKMHKTKNGKVLCHQCFWEYKQEQKERRC
jgi:hypothetical protein